MADAIHGAELDAAMDAAGGPESLGICLSALESRRNAFAAGQIEQILKLQNDVYFRRDLRVAIEREPTDEEMFELALRSVIGGTFTFGIGVGKELSKGATEAVR